MFTYGDIVLIKADAPVEMRPGQKAWVVGVFPDRNRDQFSWLPPGTVYTVEFENGDAVDITENMLDPSAE